MTVELDTALQLALRLEPAEKLRLVELVIASLSMHAQTDDMSVVPTPQRPHAGNVSMPSPITVQGYHRPRQITE
jgi:hypothetical protein